MRKRKFRVLAAMGGACLAITLSATPAFAGSITAPLCNASPCGPTNPYQALTDVNASGVGTPRFFDITGTGYTPLGTSVQVEVCDGVPSTTPGWDPTIDCDAGTSPAASLSDATGNVKFLASDTNRRLQLFDGSSPSGLFNCIRSDEPDPGNGQPTFGGPGQAPCQVRMSTSNTGSTSDQAFFSAALIKTPSVPEAPYSILLPVGALVLLGGGYVLARKRSSARAAA